MTVPKFIKVTEVYTDRNEQPLFINTAFITSVKKAKHGDTMINMSGERANVNKEGLSKDSSAIYFFVKESVEEVGRLL